MSHATPFPGIPAHASEDQALQIHIKEFQAAMYRVNDCLRRAGDNPLEAFGTLRALDYVDRQLMLSASSLDTARIAVTSIRELVQGSIADYDAGEPLPVDVAIATPDGSGRNAGAAL